MRTKSEIAVLEQRIRELRRSGLSRREIKETLGFSSNATMDRALQGEPPPSWTRRPCAKDDLHSKARDMRAQGSSMREIAAALGVSKGSVSLWTRDQPRAGRLSYEEGRRRCAEGARRYWEAERAVRAARLANIQEQAAAQIGAVSQRELIIAGAIAYWCEGTKSKPYREQQRIVFVNSDPGLIRMFLSFLAAVGVTSDRLVFRVSIHESADAAAAQEYWRSLTGAETSQFRRTSLKRHNPATVRLNTGAGYHGCLRVEVNRSAELYRQIEGWASAVIKAVTPAGQPATK